MKTKINIQKAALIAMMALAGTATFAQHRHHAHIRHYGHYRPAVVTVATRPTATVHISNRLS